MEVESESPIASVESSFALPIQTKQDSDLGPPPPIPAPWIGKKGEEMGYGRERGREGRRRGIPSSLPVFCSYSLTSGLATNA